MKKNNIKILLVGTGHNGYLASYVEEQILALNTLGIQVIRYGITQKGILGYLRALPNLYRKIRQVQPDVIHAHYGLSGLLANMQRRIPVVTTYHGSDINIPKVLRFSKIAMRLSAHNIFVSQRNRAIAFPNQQTYLSPHNLKCSLLPCGVNLTEDQLRSRSEARTILGIDTNTKVVLFAGAFEDTIKDAPLAQKSIELLGDPDVSLYELRGYTRQQVNLLMCAANCFLMTSKSEGSPQVVKEAMACGCPIVSVDVGDVAERLEGIDGCYVVESRNPKEIKDAVTLAINYVGKTNGRSKIVEMGLDNQQIAKQLVVIYEKVIHK